MPKKPDGAPPPIRRLIAVSWAQPEAYRRFTADFAKWWPSYALSIGGGRVKRMVFDCRVGGMIYEEHHDGTRFQCGKVTVVDAPRRVAFTWHSSRDEADSQLVEVSFTPNAAGTEVELVSSGWEKLGDAARSAYNGYIMAWSVALTRYAGRRNATLFMFYGMQAAITLIGQRGTFVRKALGRMPAA